jgi:hypothetical protein
MEICRFGHSGFSMLVMLLCDCEDRFCGGAARCEHFWPQESFILLRLTTFDRPIFPDQRETMSSLYMECYFSAMLLGLLKI